MKNKIDNNRCQSRKRTWKSNSVTCTRPDSQINSLNQTDFVPGSGWLVFYHLNGNKWGLEHTNSSRYRSFLTNEVIGGELQTPYCGLLYYYPREYCQPPRRKYTVIWLNYFFLTGLALFFPRKVVSAVYKFFRGNPGCSNLRPQVGVRVEIKNVIKPNPH